MEYCGQCGIRAEQGQQFCGKCGARLVGREAESPAPTTLPVIAPLLAAPRRRRHKWRYIIPASLVGLFILLAIIGSFLPPTPKTTSGVAAPVTTTALNGAAPTGATTDTAAPADTPTDTPVPADTPTETSGQWAQTASGTTFADVRDHSDLHIGDRVVWHCTINKFLGADVNDATATDVSCGADGNTLSEFVIKVPSTVDTTQMHAGDAVTVYGTVDQSFSGTNGFGAQMTDPQVAAVYVEDAAVSAQATADAQTAVAP